MHVLKFLNSISRQDQDRLMVLAGTSVSYVRKACSQGSHLGPALCTSIEKATDGQVKRWDLRPKDWHLIWPELIDTAGAPQLGGVDDAS